MKNQGQLRSATKDWIEIATAQANRMQWARKNEPVRKRAGPKTSRSENVVIAIPTPRRQDAAKQFEPMVSIKLDKAQETSRSFPEMKAMGRVYQPSRLPHPAWLQPS